MPLRLRKNNEKNKSNTRRKLSFKLKSGQSSLFDLWLALRKRILMNSEIVPRLKLLSQSMCKMAQHTFVGSSVLGPWARIKGKDWVCVLYREQLKFNIIHRVTSSFSRIFFSAKTKKYPMTANVEYNFSIGQKRSDSNYTPKIKYGGKKHFVGF